MLKLLLLVALSTSAVEVQDPGSDCRGAPSTNWNCCSDAVPCTLGEGDCDKDTQCEGDLVCGSDNCFRDFSSTTSNWVVGADCCRTTSQYAKASELGACCVSSGQQHEGCMIHSSFASVSEATCKAACDNDANCKGYAIRDANGGMFCRLATTVSNCPHNWNVISGLNGDLDASASCDPEYDGCYIKDNWSTPESTTSGPAPTTQPPQTSPPPTSVPTTSSVSQEITIACDHLTEEITVPGTTIISPNYPSEYESSSDCFAFIRFPAAQIVSLTFEAFNVEKHSRCDYDYLAVCDGRICDGDGDSDIVTLIGSKLCGRKRHLPASIESTGNVMTLHFHTDGSVNKSGFKIHVNAVAAPPATTSGPNPTTRHTTTPEPTETGSPPSNACGILPPNRIVGGGEVTPYSLPWQVALVRRRRNDPFCGGTLISDRHVLTAAHCIEDTTRFEIIVGEHDVTDSSDGTRHTKCRQIIHPNYKDGHFINNDFAIVTLTTPVQLGARAVPACLPSDAAHGGSFLDDKTVTTSGWGALSSSGSSPTVLHKVSVPGVSNTVCQEKYEDRYGSNAITADMICAGNTVDGGVDACQGDSGGPLTYNDQGREVVVGVVSWGYGCALATHPGVYSRVTAALSWINEQMLQTC